MSQEPCRPPLAPLEWAAHFHPLETKQTLPQTYGIALYSPGNITSKQMRFLSTQRTRAHPNNEACRVETLKMFRGCFCDAHPVQGNEGCDIREKGTQLNRQLEKIGVITSHNHKYLSILCSCLTQMLADVHVSFQADSQTHVLVHPFPSLAHMPNCVTKQTATKESLSHPNKPSRSAYSYLLQLRYSRLAEQFC